MAADEHSETADKENYTSFDPDKRAIVVKCFVFKKNFYRTWRSVKF